MSALRVCLISQEFPPHTNWGGIAVYNGMLAHELAQRGHEVLVISRAHGGAPARELIEEGVCVLRVGTPIWRKMLMGRTLDRILHAQMVAAEVQPLHAREPFDVFETTEASFEGECLQRDASLRSRFIIQCNGSNAFGQTAGGVLAPLHRMDWRWSHRREQQAMRLAGHIIVTSDATREVVLRQGIDEPHAARGVRRTAGVAEGDRFHLACRRGDRPAQWRAFPSARGAASGQPRR
jgi:hypothetical protein